jgi:hypothetical protein
MDNDSNVRTQVRNSLVRNFDAFVRAVYGEARHGIWLNNLKPGVKEEFIRGKFDKTWYDAEEFYTEPVITLCRIFEKGHTDAAWQSGVWGVESWLKGRMKWIFEKFNTELLLKSFLIQAALHYYKPVKIEGIKVKKGEAVITVEGMRSSESLLAFRFGGGVEKSLQVKGCKDVSVQIANSTKKRVDCTVFIVTWK